MCPKKRIAGTEGGKGVLHILGEDLFEIEIDGFYKAKGKDRRQF